PTLGTQFTFRQALRHLLLCSTFEADRSLAIRHGDWKRLLVPVTPYKTLATEVVAHARSDAPGARALWGTLSKTKLSHVFQEQRCAAMNSGAGKRTRTSIDRAPCPTLGAARCLPAPYDFLPTMC